MLGCFLIGVGLAWGARLEDEHAAIPDHERGLRSLARELALALFVLLLFVFVATRARLFLPADAYFFIPLAIHLAAVLLFALLLFPELRRHRHAELAAALALALLATIGIGLTLQTLWENAIPTQWVVAGIFQTNDAADFLASASRLLVAGAFESVHGRPAAESFLGGLLAVSSFDLRFAVLVVAAGIALVLFQAARQYAVSIGIATAPIFGAVLVDYIHEHLGSVSTEPLGFLLGTLAFTLLLRSTNGDVKFFLGGVFLFALTMVIRIGAVFVLPALLIWCFYHFPSSYQRRWRVIALALGVTATVFLGNSLLSRQVSPNSGGQFVNAADAWYAVLVNGKEALGQVQSSEIVPVARWVQIYLDHPDLRSAPRSELPARKLAIVWQELIRHPLAGVTGALLEYRDYFLGAGIFRFVDFKPLRAVLFLLSVLGGFFLIYKARSSPVHALLLAGNLGIFLSIPFLAGGGTRVIAGTVCFTAALPAMGIVAAMAIFKRQPALAPFGGRTHDSQALLMVGISFVVVLALIGTLLLGATRAGGTSTKAPMAHTCRSREDPTILAYSPGSALRFTKGEPRSMGGYTLHSVDAKALANNMKRWEILQANADLFRFLSFGKNNTRWLTEFLARMSPPFTIFLTMDRSTGALLWVVLRGDHPGEAVDTLRVCLKRGVMPREARLVSE